MAPVAREVNMRVFGKDTKGGCWDILGSRDDEVVFVECKRRGKDEINDYQRGWITSGILWVG